MPVYVFLDTNNWIYLANGFDIYSKKHGDLHLKIFETIEEKSNDGTYVFLVNEIVLKEFERNKNQTEAKIDDIQKKAAHHVSNLKPIKELFDGDDLTKLNEIEEKITSQATQRIEQQRVHIAKVEHFIKNSTVVIPVTDQHRIEAAKMAEEKKAPFIGEKKNSMADALLMLGFVDYMKTVGIIKVDFSKWGDSEVFEVENFPLSYFVSSNSGDFSDPKDREALHPDLIPLMAQSKSKFYYVLHKLLKDVEQELLTLEEEAAIENAEDWLNCEICDHEFSRIDFFNPISLFDPHLIKDGSRDKNQLGLFEEIKIPLVEPYIEVVTGECNMCSASYLICPNCQDLVAVGSANTKASCPGCHYKFILHEKRDKKGFLEKLEYEILMSQNCSHCGDEVDEVNTNGLCETCQEYEDNAINN
ncbi:PIN domain-containing protein [Pedobacter sp. PF22-3]|uniref:PIN domain-containing protein n=1 Tax=Pedobacter sp. PF22-3 TaxID=2994467 RepID=UPI002247310E|nr:PIN domain-containing protein [Pedobacter sp. PF22-3]MCX2492623.1 PIN domain-containing protein [Pedobacter sp. PF22-3]